MRSLLLPALLLASCSHAPSAAELEPLFHTLETGSAVEAMGATEKLVAEYDDSHLPRLTKALDSAPVRALQLIGELSTDGSAGLLINHLSYLLESKDAETARMAAVAAGLRRLKAASDILLHHPEEPAVVRALGRIWDTDLDSPALPRSEEIERLTVLAVVHRQAMGGGATIESCEAMLSVMTADELRSWLGKHAGDKFPSRRLCDQAVRRPGFDADKGLLIHETLLSSPDAELVAAILDSSPFPLHEERVREFAKDERKIPGGTTVGDAAAKRLKKD
jgi:hypothetical protein